MRENQLKQRAHGRNENNRLEPEVIKAISCSTQLSTNFFPLINVKMPTILSMLTFMGRKNSILGLFEPEFLDIFNLFAFKISC